MDSPGSERVAMGILDGNNVEGSRVTRAVSDDTDTTNVVTSGDHGEVSRFELDVVGDLVVLNVVDDSVVLLDMGVGETDGSAVMSGKVRNSLGSNPGLGNLQELELSFVLANSVSGETALNVVQETESFVGLVDGDDICKGSYIETPQSTRLTHETSGESHVAANLVVNLDQALHADLTGISVAEGILQTVAEEDNQRKAFTELVRSGDGARSKDTSKLVKHPMLWGG